MSDRKKSTRTSADTDSKRELKIGKDTGRVKVYVRVRPFNRDETQRRETLAINEGTIQVKTADGRNQRPYHFDHIFRSDVGNEQVSGTLTKPLVASALNGFNGTLMAYGQTGTGKTYTLFGNNGITNEVINHCFDRINHDKKHIYKVSVAYLQIYQEKIHDLLNANVKVDLSLRENPKLGVYVENLSEFVVRTPAEVMSLLNVGRKRLVFAETKMNRVSSRSHSVLQMTIERKRCKDKVKDTTSASKKSSSEGVDVTTLDNDVLVRGRIHICDLAGSERLKKTMATGDRLSEAQHINSSLLELGNVIQALADDKVNHIPFRNSVLTRLLQESLGGNCKTSLVVCVSPSEKDLSETKCTLAFGSRAIKITNTAYINMEVDFKKLSETLVKKMQEKEDEIMLLKKSHAEDMDEMQSTYDKKLRLAEKENSRLLEKQLDFNEQRIQDLEKALAEAEDELEMTEANCNNLKRQLIEMGNCMKEEQHQTKILLLIEALSMKLMATAETQCRTASTYQLTPEERGKLTRSVVQHVDSLMDYIKLTVGKDDMATTDDLKLLVSEQSSSQVMEREENNEPMEFEAENVRAKLLATKGLLDATMFDILKQHNVQPPTGAYDTGSSMIDKYKTSIGSLFKLLVDKAMLSCIVILEKLDAEQRSTNNSGTVDVFHEVTPGIIIHNQHEDDREPIFETCQVHNVADGGQLVRAKERPRVKKEIPHHTILPRDKQVTWDDMCEEFECTLSRIDNLLADSAGALDNLPQNNKKLYNDIIERTRLEGEKGFSTSSEDEEDRGTRRRISIRRSMRSIGLQTIDQHKSLSKCREVQTQTMNEETRRPSVLDKSSSEHLIMLQHLDGELTSMISVSEELREENARLKNGIKYLLQEEKKKQIDVLHPPNNIYPGQINDVIDSIQTDTTTLNEKTRLDGAMVSLSSPRSTMPSDFDFFDERQEGRASTQNSVEYMDVCSVNQDTESPVIADADRYLSCSPTSEASTRVEIEPVIDFNENSQQDTEYLKKELKSLQWQVKKSEDEAACYYNLLSDILSNSDLFVEFLALDSDILKLRDIIKDRRSNNSFKRNQSSKPRHPKRRQAIDARLRSKISGSCSSDPESPNDYNRRCISAMPDVRQNKSHRLYHEESGSDIDSGVNTELNTNLLKLPNNILDHDATDRMSPCDHLSLPIMRNVSPNDVIIQKSWSLKDLFMKRKTPPAATNTPNAIIQ